MGATVKVNTKGLDQFRKAFKGKPPSIRIGILGDGRNATIGAAHEFGTSKLPVRSFLRVPIAEHLNGYLEKSGAFDKETLKKVVKEGSIMAWSLKIAKIAETIVLEAFATGGFGKWAAWRPGYTNNTGMILVDSQQLRNSITSQVK